MPRPAFGPESFPAPAQSQAGPAVTARAACRPGRSPPGCSWPGLFVAQTLCCRDCFT